MLPLLLTQQYDVGRPNTEAEPLPYHSPIPLALISRTGDFQQTYYNHTEQTRRSEERLRQHLGNEEEKPRLAALVEAT